MEEDIVTMRDGRVRVIRGGRILEIQEDILLLEGTRVTPDGTIVMADGTTRTMMEGEALTMDGEITELEELEGLEDLEEEDLEDEDPDPLAAVEEDIDDEDLEDEDLEYLDDLEEMDEDDE